MTIYISRTFRKPMLALCLAVSVVSCKIETLPIPNNIYQFYGGSQRVQPISSPEWIQNVKIIQTRLHNAYYTIKVDSSEMTKELCEPDRFFSTPLDLEADFINFIRTRLNRKGESPKSCEQLILTIKAVIFLTPGRSNIDATKTAYNESTFSNQYDANGIFRSSGVSHAYLKFTITDSREITILEGYALGKADLSNFRPTHIKELKYVSSKNAASNLCDFISTSM